MEKNGVIERTSRWCHHISVTLAVLGCLGSLINAIGVSIFLEDLTGKFNWILFLAVLLTELFVTVCGSLPLYALSVVLDGQNQQQQYLMGLSAQLENKTVPTTTKCPHCGKEVTENSPFCGFCGTRISRL